MVGKTAADVISAYPLTQTGDKTAFPSHTYSLDHSHLKNSAKMSPTPDWRKVT